MRFLAFALLQSLIICVMLSDEAEVGLGVIECPSKHPHSLINGWTGYSDGKQTQNQYLHFCTTYTGFDLTNVYRRFFYKKIKNAFLTFLFSQRFSYFQQLKTTQITFPNFSNTGNVLTIKNNGIQP